MMMMINLKNNIKNMFNLENLQVRCLKFSLLLILFLIIQPNLLQSQSESKNKLYGKISGKVVDSDSSKALAASSCVLFRLSDSTLIQGVISDNEGKFEFEKVPFGSYFIKITYVGYKNKNINEISLSEKNNKIKLGKIKLHSTDVDLNSIEINANRDFIQIEPDKQIIYIDKNLISVGGTAVDALRSVPSISVDIDDNIKLRGNDNIKFLLDGKESNNFESDFLETISASDIDRIEIITNPSSKYDAESNSGIINIILKQNKKNETTAQINLNAGTGDKYSGSLYWGQSFKKFSYFINYSYKSNNMFGVSDQTQDRYSIFDSSITQRHQNDLQKKRNHGLRLGFDYSLNENNIISFSAFLINHNKEISKDRNYYDYTRSMVFDDYHEKNINNPNVQNNLDLNLNYKLLFDKNGHNLTFSSQYSPSQKENTFSYIHKYFKVNNGLIIKNETPDYLQKSLTTNDGFNLTLQADYNLPLSKSAKLEMGYKNFTKKNEMQFEFDNQINNLWIYDSTRSNNFNYNENTNAAYAIFIDNFFRFSYHIGLRAEYTTLSSNQITTNQTKDTNYLYLFPSIQLKYDLTPFSNLRLSASRRINRPKMKQLNPFVNYSDPQELTSGNPNLIPELTNQGELGYFQIFNNTTFLANLFYKNSQNSIATLAMLNDTNAVISSPQNYSHLTNTGLEIIISQDFFKWLRADANFSYYNSDIVGNFNNQDLSFNKNCWNSKMSIYLNYGKSLTFQISMIYHSKEYSLQTINDEYFTTDFGLKYNIIKNKLSLNLKINDAFKTMKSGYYTVGPNFTIDNLRYKDSRYIMLGINYTFNELSTEAKNKLDNEDDEENYDSNYIDE